jgi:PLD-like domain
MSAAALAEQLKLLSLQPGDSLRVQVFPVRPRLLKVKGLMRGQARSLVRAENADELVSNWPSQGDSVHAVLSGEFVMGDLIDRVRSLRGNPQALWISTLSLGLPNVQTLKNAALDGVEVRVLVSHYFQSADESLYNAIAAELLPVGVRLYIGRLHAKVILFDYLHAPVVITTSANLRSSNNLEQADVFAWPDLFFFHRHWMSEVIARAEAGSNPTFAIRL